MSATARAYKSEVAKFVIYDHGDSSIHVEVDPDLRVKLDRGQAGEGRGRPGVVHGGTILLEFDIDGCSTDVVWIDSDSRLGDLERAISVLECARDEMARMEG